MSFPKEHEISAEISLFTIQLILAPWNLPYVLFRQTIQTQLDGNQSDSDCRQSPKSQNPKLGFQSLAALGAPFRLAFAQMPSLCHWAPSGLATPLTSFTIILHCSKRSTSIFMNFFFFFNFLFENNILCNLVNGKN